MAEDVFCSFFFIICPSCSIAKYFWGFFECFRHFDVFDVLNIVSRWCVWATSPQSPAVCSTTCSHSAAWGCVRRASGRWKRCSATRLWRASSRQRSRWPCEVCPRRCMFGQSFGFGRNLFSNEIIWWKSLVFVFEKKNWLGRCCVVQSRASTQPMGWLGLWAGGWGPPPHFLWGVWLFLFLFY